MINKFMILNLSHELFKKKTNEETVQKRKK